MDIIHDTQGSFKESESYKHHRTLFSLKSVREEFREKDDKKIS